MAGDSHHKRDGRRVPASPHGSIAPQSGPPGGQRGFCTKICSKIITAQFCIVLLNDDRGPGGTAERPNANVNMEYGLMLGHNKYVIPFQKEEQSLPFNVAGLDTIKYNSKNFSDLAKSAIEAAISHTAPKENPQALVDQTLMSFLLSKDTYLSDIIDPGERAIFSLGNACGFKLLISLDGLSYTYLGIFATLRSSTAKWRISKLNDTISGRFSAIPKRLELGAAQPQPPPALIEHFLTTLRVWVIVTGSETKAELGEWAKQAELSFGLEVYTVAEVEAEADQYVR